MRHESLVLKHSVLVLLVLLMLGLGNGEARGSAEPSGFLFRTLEHGGVSYPYAVYVPRGLDRTEPVRGLVFLHGRGECGRDGSKQLAVGLPTAMMLEPDRWPFVVVLPQKPSGFKEWEDYEDVVLAMLDRTIAEERVDPDRVAITGLSQGGHGTIVMASRQSGRFRAAAPVCGYVKRWWVNGKRGVAGESDDQSTEQLVRSLADMPMWLFHGGRDQVVAPKESEWLNEQLEGLDAPTRLTIFPKDNHNSWDSAYRGSELAAWLVKMTE